jgi:hypothetical protein
LLPVALLGKMVQQPARGSGKNNLHLLACKGFLPIIDVGRSLEGLGDD